MSREPIPTTWKALAALLVLGAVRSAAAAPPLCPKGEVTLAGGKLRIVARHGAPPRVSSTRATFVLPVGLTIAPASEAIVVALEGDRETIATTTLPAGSLGVDGKSRRFAYRTPDSALSLTHLRGTYRLNARLGDVDLSAFDVAQPPHFVKQILKIGDDCFSAVYTCVTKSSGLACAHVGSCPMAGARVAFRAALVLSSKQACPSRFWRKATTTASS